MFTGIITDIGTVTAISGELHRSLEMHCHYPLENLEIGNSIACDGVCLTVTDKGEAKQPDYRSWFTADVSQETLRSTTIGAWKCGAEVNLERGLVLGEELGGHLVMGHVDGLAEILSVEQVDVSHRVIFRVPEAWQFHLAPKGSVALNGVSLTVNRVKGAEAEVNLIPHSWKNTTLRNLKPGDRVHFEVDLVARYLARLMEART